MKLGCVRRGSRVERLVFVIDRLVTWGMEPVARDAMLTEQAADWEAMSRDYSRWRMMARQLRGIPLAIWWRLTRGEVTALPAAGGMFAITLATVLAGTAFPEFPASHRQCLLLVSAGSALAGWHLTRHPREIIAASFRYVGLLGAVGAAGAASTLPRIGDWSYPVHSATIDGVMEIGIYLLAIGAGAMFVASLQRRPRTTVLVAGGSIVAGASTLAITEVAWSLVAVQVDVLLGLGVLPIAFGAGLLAHMILRLRHLEIH